MHNKSEWTATRSSAVYEKGFSATRHPSYRGMSAEDVAQEVLMVLHEKYAAVDRIEDLAPVVAGNCPIQNLGRAPQERPARRKYIRFRSTIFRWPAAVPIRSSRPNGASAWTIWNRR